MAEVYTEKELLNAIRDAYSGSKKVMVLGYGKHSELRRADIYLHIKMDHYDIKDDRVIAEAGASVSKIREEAIENGLLLPTFYDGSVGGLLANNPISPLSTSYGRPTNFTEWVDFVTPYKLFRWKGIIGSKGSFGAITKAQLKLYKKPIRVYTYEATIEDSVLLRDAIDKFVKYNPLVLLVEYVGNGKYQFHCSLTQDVQISGFNKDEGVPNIEESNRNSYYVKTNTIEEFISLINKINPIYAYTIINSGYTKIYVTDEELLSSSGYNYFNVNDTPSIYKRIKRVLDFKNIFA